MAAEQAHRVEDAAAELARLGASNAAIERRVDALDAAAEDAAARVAQLDSVLEALALRDLPAGMRSLRQPAGPQRRAICSLATGAYRSLLSRSGLSYERYAERWGWDVVLTTEDLAEGRPAPWGKIPFLRSLLDEYDWVLWLDADVVVVDLDADIGAEVRERKDLYLVEHAWGEHTANSGVMLLRSSPWTKAFLDEVWAREEHTHHPWWENAAVLELLGYALSPARLTTPTPWLARTRMIDRRWNSVEPDRAARPAFVHRGFYDPATRTRQITADLQCALAGADPLTAGWERPARRIRAVSDVKRREELPLLLTELGLTGTGVEVGVREGAFSEWLLEHWSGGSLVSADPWAANLEETRRRLARFGDRSTVRRCSPEAEAASFAPGTLDFVYLDARHDEPAMRADLEQWWPLVRTGGIIAGRSEPGRFFADRDEDVHRTVDDEPWSGWVVHKRP